MMKSRNVWSHHPQPQQGITAEAALLWRALFHAPGKYISDGSNVPFETPESEIEQANLVDTACVAAEAKVERVVVHRTQSDGYGD
ncbi:hypothetical protein PHSY_005732 [Pseudozyma hubeiensis SY62]|uniref:Uncharacterized protein n=1 Tax=Pseudozyma hubeiensis (strain SY62) TaxID=1305764 RepID=R9P9S7_PSEHS|nr:hypothetical protein PHSY_005732 [Pseudozyma hubeiensis SY62]GAC98143.1 hypothetical protein PHSY_005732 [Pseudozyma hubeiensis SY62]